MKWNIERLVVLLLIIFCVQAKEIGVKSPLILTGIDTLLTNELFGFDFVEQKACTSSSDYPGCHQHFYFQDFGNAANLTYDLRAWLGYGIKLGKVNLDSVKIAPSDSIFYLNDGKIDIISGDSLFFRIGHSYILKTGQDPRDQTIRFAKIRILNFRILDSANRRVEMRFLWACNVTGPRRELETSNLDTFDFNTSNLSRGLSAHRKTTPNNVFKVVGDRFIVPKELIGTGAYLTLYDLTGKKLGRVVVGNRNAVDLRVVRKSQGAVVVRIQ